LRGAEEADRGTITQLLGYGMVRLLWDSPQLTSIHRHEQLTKLSEHFLALEALVNRQRRME
jgi:hypothetical protein